MDRQRDRTKKLYRTLKECLGTTKVQVNSQRIYSKRCTINYIQDEMGHLHRLLDEMGINQCQKRLEQGVGNTPLGRTNLVIHRECMPI